MKKKLNHQQVADRVETVSMCLGIISAVVSGGAALATPTGLSWVAVTLGVTSLPLIVAAAPVIGTIASVCGAVSGGTYFYSKWKSKKGRRAGQ